MTEVVKESPTLRWSTYEIWSDDVKHYMEDEGLSEKEAQERASNSDSQEFAWDDLCECLTDWMKEINPDGNQWHGTVENFGWQHRSGEKDFTAKNGKELLRMTLPDTDCTFTIWNRGDCLRIDNAHHDAPTGGEIYEIYPVKETDE